MIYLLKRQDDVGWDENQACIVRASSPERARAFASKRLSEGNIWESAEKVTCTPVPNKGKEEMILADFLNG